MRIFFVLEVLLYALKCWWNWHQNSYLLEPWCGKNLALVVPDEVFPAVVCCCCCCCPDDEEGTGPLGPPEPAVGLLDGLDCGFGLSAIDVIFTDLQFQTISQRLSFSLLCLLLLSYHEQTMPIYLARVVLYWRQQSFHNSFSRQPTSFRLKGISNVTR